MGPKKQKAKTIVWMLALIWPALAISNPTGPTVVAGNASFSNPSKDQLNIKTSDQSIIHWQDFSIASGEMVKFIQPSKNATVLNRVITGNPSALLGTLEANGRVYLINPNGVLVGKDGVINTAGFAASTLDILDEAFLGQGDLLFLGDSKASVVNYGTITAWDGDVTLIGYSVENKGKLNAPEGSVALAAGQEVLLKPSSQEKLFIRPKQNDQERSGVGISNTGRIEALQTELKADGNPYALAINHSGSIDALDVHKEGGRIMLVAEGGNAKVGGTMLARSGEVKVLGDQVHLTDKAVIDVSGDKTGGQVYVGGGLRGKDSSIYNSSETIIDAGAVISADAKIDGNGGKVIIWSANDTQFEGQISAQGGHLRGDGGFVEVSGKHLGYTGQVTTSAENGKTGDLLLDPTDIHIRAIPPTTLSSVNAGGTIYYFDSTSLSSVLNVTDLVNSLNTNNVTVETLSVGLADGDIFVHDPVTWTSSNLLTLSADRDIFVSAALNGSAGNSSLIFHANRDFIVDTGLVTTGGAGQTITVHAGRDIKILTPSILGEAWNNPGNLSMVAGRDISTGSTTVFICSNASSCNFVAGNNISLGDHSNTSLAGSAQLFCQNFSTGDGADLKADHSILTINAANDITIGAHNNVHFYVTGSQALNAGHDIIVGSGTNFFGSFELPITFIANKSISTLGPVSIIAGEEAVVTLVADNAFPSAPNFDHGHLSLPGIYIIGPGGIRLFSAIRDLDHFEGAIFNNVPFVHGPEFVNTPTEQWGTYYPSSFGGSPYTSFYKNTAPPPRPPIPTVAIDRYLDALAEPFWFWDQFDIFHFADDLVSFRYSSECYCCDKEFMTIPFEFNDDSGSVVMGVPHKGKFNIRYCHNGLHGAYIYYRTFGPIDWITQRPWCCVQ